VYPGDLIVADGDGVLVVPRELALEVGKIAREIHIDDEKSRAARYKRLGIPLDKTITVE
jgi:regulator of RNase E activity RraA